MMKIFFLIIILLITTLSCSKDIEDNTPRDGHGVVSFNLKAGKEDILIRSKSNGSVDNGASSLPYRLSIYNDENELVEQVDTLNAENANISLLAKTYKVVAEAGKLRDAAFDSPYYYSDSTVTVAANEIQQIDLKVKLNNIKVSVEYAEDLANYISGAETKVKIGETGDILTYNLEEERSGYFKAENDLNKISWSISIFPIDGEEQTFSSVIDDIKANDHLIFRFSVDDNDIQTGGFRLNKIIVKEEVVGTDEHDFNIGLDRFPEIKLGEGDIDEIHNIVLSSFENITVSIEAFPSISYLRMDNNIVRLHENIDNSVNKTVNIFTTGNDSLSPATITDYAEEGVAISYETSSNSCSNPVKITISKTLIQNIPITQDGADPYTFTFTVKDKDDREIKRILSFNRVDSDVLTDFPKNTDIWATKMIVTGKWVDEKQPTSVGFEYSQDGTVWIEETSNIEIDDVNKSFTKKILGLTSFTTYSVRAIGDKKGNIVKVTTAPATQLYNMGFNHWSKEGNAHYARENSGTAFWDSGNKGATTIGSNNPTEPENSDVMEGTSAARLTSKVIVGNFAAGNLFIGEFISVDIFSTTPNMTFGRPFNGRPSALKGLYKYKNAIINYAGGGKESLSGQWDRFNMIVILTDGTNMPKRLNQKNKSPFDIDEIMKSGTDGYVNAIASGMFTNEVDQTEQVTMNGYDSFDIKLKYHEKNKDLSVSYVVIIFSASKYGDFFTGGEGSELKLDDLSFDYNFTE